MTCTFHKEPKNIKILLRNKEGFLKDFALSNEAGDWQMKNVAVGKYELIIDANDDLPEDKYDFVEGERDQEVKITEGQTAEINVVVKLK